ncbi:hypothetical protein HSE3_gp005 [Klebsiella phage vB_KleS-HSE3]|nr:hypothetical protein HSE3_gp005 [Klebsiella phage vB_KleS-HSE3]
MKKHNVIHIDTAEFHNAVYILGREEKIYNWNQNVEFRKRLVGLLGEIAAAKHLNNIHGRNRIVIPMGVNARTGVSVNAFGQGDIMTVSRVGVRHRQIHIYEVKSTEGTGKQLPTSGRTTRKAILPTALTRSFWSLSISTRRRRSVGYSIKCLRLRWWSAGGRCAIATGRSATLSTKHVLSLLWPPSIIRGLFFWATSSTASPIFIGCIRPI